MVDLQRLRFVSTTSLSFLEFELITLEEECRIKLLPVAKVPTFKFKKCVYVDEYFVWKGPYKINDAGLRNNLACTRAARKIEESIACKLFVMDLEVCKIEDRYYLKMKKISSNGGPAKCVCDFEEKTLPRQVLVDMLQHFYFRWLFKIGDCSFNNVLLDGTNVCGIDFDEECSRDEVDDLKKYFKRMSKQQEVLFRPLLDSIATLDLEGMSFEGFNF